MEAKAILDLSNEWVSCTRNQEPATEAASILSAIHARCEIDGWGNLEHMKESITSASQSRLEVIEQQLESLPIIISSIADIHPDNWSHFVLLESEGGWAPVSVASENKNGWLEFFLPDRGSKGLSGMQGVARFGRWATCSIDNKPCMPVSVLV